MAGFKGWKKKGYWLNSNNKDLLIITISKLPFNTNCQNFFLSGFDRPIPGVLNKPPLTYTDSTTSSSTHSYYHQHFLEIWKNLTKKERKKKTRGHLSKPKQQQNPLWKKWIHSCRNPCLRNWDKVKMQEKENNHRLKLYL